MTKTIKKVIACILSILMVITSVPFAVFAEDALTSVKNAMTAYEDAMDGTVYTNMKSAFDAYVKAKQDTYAYEVGGKTDVDLASDAEALTQATNTMTANKWTSPKGTATASFPADTDYDTDASYEGYAENLLYFGEMSKVEGGTDVKPSEKYAGAAAISTHEYANENTSTGGKHRTTIAMYYPVTVMLYDGDTTPVMPVMAMAHITESNGGTEVVRYVYGLYPAKDASGTNDASSTFKMKNQFWNFDNAQNDYMSNNWRYTMAQNNNLVATNPNDIRQSTAMKLSDYKGFGMFGVNWWTYYPAALANGMQYSGGDSAFNSADNKYLITENINWRRHTGSQMDTEYGTPSDYMTFTAKLSFPTYVVNYKALKDTIKDAVAVVSANPSAYLINKAKASAMLGAVDNATAYNPNNDFANDNAPSANAETCANNIKTHTDAINAFAPESRLNAEYVTLENAINESKATYEAGNANKHYTEDSFTTFVTAYENAVADAKKVAADGFTSTTAGNTLYSAYRGLNVQALDTGESGNTEYDFDEASGSLNITPKDGTDGKMQDYEKADDSPFGNNENITEVVIDPNVTYIGAHTFDGASNLETITVPAGATYGEGAFDNCPKLKTVIIVGGDVANDSATNSPWIRPTVNVIKLGADLDDKSITSIGDKVFEGKENTAFYVYNENCTIPSTTNNTFGINPTIHGSNPSTAYTYNQTYPEPTTTFVQINHTAHTWVLIATVERNCTRGGYKQYECSVCGETKKEDEQEPLGHEWDKGTVTSPATCTTPGTIVYTCTHDSSHKKTAVIDATGHNWEVTSTTATCTDSGITTYTCVNCTTEKTIFSNKLGHDYVATVVEPTCTEFGYTEYSCSRCDSSYKSDYKPTSKDNHNWIANKVVEPTCTAQGYTVYSCINCGATENKDYKPAKGHNWDAGKVTKVATVEETGIMTYTCKNDPSHTYTKVIPKATVAPVPSAAEANKAPVNAKIPKINAGKISTVSNLRTKKMTVKFGKVSGAQNYRVAFRKAGAKKWTYYWTGGKSTYVFTKLQKNQLYEFMFAAYRKNAKGKWERGNWSAVNYRYFVKGSVKKVTSKKKTVTMTWPKDKKASYYEIFYSTNKNMSKNKKIKVAKSKSSYTIKKLKKGKMYYVRVRTVRTYNKKTYYGELSNVKKIKCK